MQTEMGFSLYADESLGNMEEAYEAQMASPSHCSGTHLKPEWANRLSSPNIRQ